MTSVKLTTKSVAQYQQRVYQRKVQNVNDSDAASDSMCGLEWNRTLTGDVIDQRRTCLHAWIRDTGGYFQYSMRQELVKAFRLSLNLLLNKTLISEYRQFPDIYVSQGMIVAIRV